MTGEASIEEALILQRGHDVIADELAVGGRKLRVIHRDELGYAGTRLFTIGDTIQKVIRLTGDFVDYGTQVHGIKTPNGRSPLKSSRSVTVVSWFVLKSVLEAAINRTQRVNLSQS